MDSPECFRWRHKKERQAFVVDFVTQGGHGTLASSSVVLLVITCAAIIMFTIGLNTKSWKYTMVA